MSAGVAAPNLQRATMASRVRGRPGTVALGLVGALAVLLVTGVAIGSVSIAPSQTIAVIVERLFGVDLGVAVSPAVDTIVWDIRLPRVLTSFVVGAGLAVAGATFQGLLRNPLADPFVLGISSGASTGAVLVIVAGIGGGLVGLASGAFVGALVAFGLVLALAALAGGGTERVVLAGVAGTQLFAAVTSFVVFSSADAEQTRGVLFWLLGSLSGASWNDVAVCAGVCGLGLLLCLTQASALDALAFGEDTASALGVEVGRVRVLLLVITALLTAVLVSAAGAIGFVGLALPHAARMLVGPGHRRLLPATALAGAIFLVWVDTAARTLFAPQELPVGVVTALLGVPAFAAILARAGRRR
jgi:iron complex transport system permease protein